LGGAALTACASLSGLSGGSDGGVDASSRVDAGHAEAGRRDSTADAGSKVDASHVDVAVRDASDARATFADAGSDAPCTHAEPPPPPSSTSPGDKTVSLVFALHEFTSGFAVTSGDAGVLGFDLDEQCTCPGPPSCTSPSMAPNCDLEPGGHDIAANSFVSMLDTQLAGTSGGDLNTRLSKGLFTLLVTVSQYNGGADDTGVVVAVMTSSGIAGDAGPPNWDGTDIWNVDPASTVGPVVLGDGGAYAYTPRYFVTDAYVANHVLVAHFRDNPLVIGLSIGTLEVGGSILMASLTAGTAGQYTASGVIAGRFTTYSTFQLLGRLDYRADGGEHKLCGNDPIFTFLKSNTCAATDIMGLPSQDSTGQACNALSFASGIESVSARLGPPVASTYDVAGCDGGVTDCTQ
jgi:hypothetical protein